MCFSVSHPAATMSVPIDKIQRRDTMCVCVLSHVQLYVTRRTVTHQTPLSMGFSRQQYWSGLPFPTPRDLPNPGIQPVSLASSALAGGFFNSVPKAEIK